MWTSHGSEMAVNIIENGFYNISVPTVNNFTNSQKISSTSTTDSTQISRAATYLNNSQVDLQNSNISEINGELNFHIEFNKTESYKTTADGTYSEKEKKLKVDLKIVLENIFGKGNQNKSSAYQIELSINSSKIEINSTSKKVLKENIHEFLSRVLNQLTMLLNSGDKNVTGIVFSKEDLQDLIGLGDKEIGKLLDEISMLVKTLSKLKKEKNPEAESVLFQPERQKENVIENRNEKKSSVEIRMIVSEIKNNPQPAQ